MTTQPRPASAALGSNPAYEAARAYYEHNETQAEIAARMGVSRATVSRLLTDARESGIVRIQVVNPDQHGMEDLAARTASALGLQRVYVAAGNQSQELGRGVNPQARQALLDMNLAPGDVLLVSSGRTIYEVGRTELPPLPGVVVAPTVGGQAEPEPWYQTNEITRAVAQQVQAHPAFLFAEAKPSPVMFEALQHDPGFGHIQSLWAQAKGALVGIGAPTSTRSSISPAIPAESAALQQAVGDVCLHFFDRTGAPLDFPGHERMIRTPLSVLRAMEHCVGIAVGENKTPGIVAAARAGIINGLVTDELTAKAVLAALGGHSG